MHLANSSFRPWLCIPWSWAHRHRDMLAVVFVVIAATVLRMAFAYRAPVFIRQDSITYFQSAYDLVHGTQLDIPLRRTPGYPLFLAGAMWLVGEDFQSIALVQHVLGALTAVLAYLIGRSIFGRAAGFAAGILVAISGPLLIYEHYLMAEALFTFLVALAIWLWLLGMRHGAMLPFLASGLVIGLASQARPVGLAVLPALWMGPFLKPTSWRARCAQVVFLTLGFAAAAAPTFIWNRLRASEAAPVLGQTLYDRVARHDERFVLPAQDSPARTDDPRLDDPRLVEARRTVIQLAARDARPSAVSHRLRTSLGLTEAEADRAMRDFALEVIGGQRERYVDGTLRKVRALLLGEPERYTFHWNTRVERELRESWQSNASIAHALGPPSESQRREQPAAAAVMGIFDPARHRGALGTLIAIGLVAAVARPDYRPALVLGLVTLALVLPAAALVGQVFRYRYPADPLLAVLAGGGLAVLVNLALTVVRRPRAGRAHGRRGSELLTEAGSHVSLGFR